jgi:hypothetical protein
VSYSFSLCGRLHAPWARHNGPPRHRGLIFYSQRFSIILCAMFALENRGNIIAANHGIISFRSLSISCSNTRWFQVIAASLKVSKTSKGPSQKRRTSYETIHLTADTFEKDGTRVYLPPMLRVDTDSTDLSLQQYITLLCVSLTGPQVAQVVKMDTLVSSVPPPVASSCVRILHGLAHSRG